MLLAGDNSCITSVDYPWTGVVACCSVLHDRSQSERDTRPSAPLPDGLHGSAPQSILYQASSSAPSKGIKPAHQAFRSEARALRPGPHKEIDYG